MTVIGFLAGSAAFLCTVYIMRRPAGFLVKLLGNSLSGFAALVLINTLLSAFGVSGAGVNAVTCLSAGILGLPGVAAVYILSMLL